MKDTKLELPTIKENIDFETLLNLVIFNDEEKILNSNANFTNRKNLLEYQNYKNIDKQIDKYLKLMQRSKKTIFTKENSSQENDYKSIAINKKPHGKDLQLHISPNDKNLYIIINELISNRCITMNFVESLYEGRGKSRLKATPNEMYEALNGKIRGQHIILLTIHNNNILFLEKQIEEIEKEIDVLLQKESESIDILNTIPGINITSAACIIAEIGSDMSVFPTEKHLSSWAGLCPKNNESAGKKREVALNQEIHG